MAKYGPRQITDQRFYRNCPECGVIITYTWDLSFEVANKLNSLCEACSEEALIRKKRKLVVRSRKCPSCFEEIPYTTEQGFNTGVERNSICMACHCKNLTLRKQKKMLTGLQHNL